MTVYVLCVVIGAAAGSAAVHLVRWAVIAWFDQRDHDRAGAYYRPPVITPITRLVPTATKRRAEEVGPPDADPPAT